MSRHKWESVGDITKTPSKCKRPGCSAARRVRKVGAGETYTYREEYSVDGGQTWGDLKTGFSGRVPECKGGRDLVAQGKEGEK
jgi:hypothetical protein